MSKSLFYSLLITHTHTDIAIFLVIAAKKKKKKKISICRKKHFFCNLK